MDHEGQEDPKRLVASHLQEQQKYDTRLAPTILFVTLSHNSKPTNDRITVFLFRLIFLN